MSPTSKKPPTQHSPAAGAARTSAAAIQVDELRLRGDPWLEDIALRYAAGKTDEILAEIRQRTQDPASATDPAPWRMLFDLYEALGRREAYEELALAFAVRFERSPPAWSVATRSVTGAPAEPAVHAFARADGIEPAGLRRCLGEAQNAPYIRLDFTGTNVPGDTDARAMLDCIGRLRKLGKAIEVVGGAAFLVRLRSACASPRGEAGVWLLRLALEELLGDQAGFEETALQYAIRFEMSPPSYSAPKPLPLPQPERREEAPAVQADTFVLEGTLGAKAAAQLAALDQFARTRRSVRVNMARVARIEFGASGMLLDSLMQIAQRGCQLRLFDCNLLVGALLGLLGADQYAQVTLRRHR